MFYRTNGALRQAAVGLRIGDVTEPPLHLSGELFPGPTTVVDRRQLASERMPAPAEHVPFHAQHRHRVGPSNRRPVHALDFGCLAIVNLDEDPHLIVGRQDRLKMEEAAVLGRALVLNTLHPSAAAIGRPDEQRGVEGDGEVEG